MFIARDENGNRVMACNAIKSTNYFCPVCGGRVVLKDGESKASHFAHQADECSDGWHYDMSEWHQKMQSFFSVEDRENVLSNSGKTHRADILKDGIVIEFQHSSISAEEFCDRNDFYTGLGLRVAWVFDVTDQFREGQLSFVDRNDNKLFMRWRWPKQILQYASANLQKPSNIALWLTWEDEEFPDCDELPYLYRIKWEAEGFKQILLSQNGIEMGEDIDVRHFLFSDKDWLRDYLKEYSAYKTLKVGIRGGRQEEYICPRTSKFGIKLFGNYGCNYCRHCVAIEEAFDEGKYVYCSYPASVRELDGIDSEYECSGAKWFRQ